MTITDLVGPDSIAIADQVQSELKQFVRDMMKNSPEAMAATMALFASGYDKVTDDPKVRQFISSLAMYGMQELLVSLYEDEMQKGK